MKEKEKKKQANDEEQPQVFKTKKSVVKEWRQALIIGSLTAWMSG